MLLFEPTTLQMGQFSEPSFYQIVRGEANAYSDGTFNPVHAETFIKAVLDSLLAVENQVKIYLQISLIYFSIY